MVNEKKCLGYFISILGIAVILFCLLSEFNVASFSSMVTNIFVFGLTPVAIVGVQSIPQKLLSVDDGLLNKAETVLRIITIESIIIK